MKNNNSIALNLSEQQEKLIKKIQNHFKTIDEDIDFQKYSHFLNSELVNSIFTFEYNKDVLFAKESDIIDQFQYEKNKIDFIDPFFVENNFIKFYTVDKLCDENLDFIENKINEFKNNYFDSKVEDFLILWNSFVFTKDPEDNFKNDFLDEERKTINDKTIEDLINSISNNNSKDLTSKYIQEFLKTQNNFEKYNLRIKKIKWISKVSTFLFILLFIAMMLMIFLL